MEEIKNETKEQKNDTVQVIEKTEEPNETVEKQEQKNEKNEEKNIELVPKEETKTDEPQKKSKKGLIFLVIAIVLIAIIGILSTIFAVVNLGNTKIMKGITIGKIDVSNLTKEEAKQTLEEIYLAKSKNEIYLKYGENETAITYEALEVEYQIEEAVNKAYEIGRQGNIFKDNLEILKTWIKGKEIDLAVTLDTEMVGQIAQNINNSLEGAVIQPSYYIENEKLIITSGKTGNQVDEKELLKQIYIILEEKNEISQSIEIPTIIVEPQEIDIEKIHEEVYKQVQDAYYTQNPFTIYPESEGIDFDVENAKTILAEVKEEYEIPLVITKPAKTVKEIGTEAFPDKLGSCSTNYNAGNKNRTTNLILAAQKINGTVLLPGEEFSYNKIVGERTISAGFKEAAVYSNGQVVDGLGGGICQISSTLYDAVIYANLSVTERRNHQFVTSYLPAGKDATVVWGSQDFKFVNTRKYPIRIEATVNGGVATITIWGLKEEVEYDITIETKKIATIAYTTQYIQDPSLPIGKEVVQQAGSNGRKVEAYKVVKLNGKVVSTTLLSKDTYNAMKRIVRVGTKPQ